MRSSFEAKENKAVTDLWLWSADGKVQSKSELELPKGVELTPSATAVRPQLAGRAWEAMGVSLVLHPRNPYCPTAHMNVRCFVARKDGEDAIWWFGGGMDLTPYYGFEEDVRHFHATCRKALEPFGEALSIEEIANFDPPPVNPKSHIEFFKFSCSTDCRKSCSKCIKATARACIALVNTS